MPKLEITAIGLSTRVVLPQEMRARLKVREADSPYAIGTAEAYLLTPQDPAIADEIGPGEPFMKQYRDAFKALAE